jgi:hypothetical protein
MHRAAVATFLAIVVAACLSAPGLARATEDPGVTYVDSIEDADVVLIGQAQEAHQDVP